MTREDDASSDNSSSASWIPDDAILQKAIKELAQTQDDVEELSNKKLLRMVARKLAVSVDDLSSKKNFIHQTLKWEIEQQKAKEEADDDSLPTEQEIQAAASKLARKVDIEATSFKKFIRVLCDELDVEDLTPAQSILRPIYDEAVEKAEQTNKKNKKRKSSSSTKKKFPSDERIVKACKRLGESSKIDLEDISKTKFLQTLQTRMGGLDLSSKKELVYATLRDLKTAQDEAPDSMRLSEITTSKSIMMDGSMVTATTMDPSSSMITPPVSFSTTLHEESDEENQKKPESFPEKPRKSAECEQGWRIPEAEGMEWTDDFFDDDFKNIVAVFDHDYKRLMRYFIKVAIFTNILPIFTFMWTLIILFQRAVARAKRDEEECDSYYDDYYYPFSSDCSNSLSSVFRALRTTFLVIELLHMTVGAYGWYRITHKYIHAMHVAVMRDGVRIVLDDHLKRWPILAGLHIFDICLMTSRQEEMIPFDQIVNFRTKGAGEVPSDLGCCCFWICGCCLRIPFETIEAKTACDTPRYTEGVMWGLFEPKKLCDLVFGMKRDKGEQIHRDANEQRAKQAKRAEEQRAMDSERRARESQNMMQMMSMMMQQNREMMMSSQNVGGSNHLPQSGLASPQSSSSSPPPPPPTR